MGAVLTAAGLVAGAVGGFWISVPVGCFVVAAQCLVLGLLFGLSDPEEATHTTLDSSPDQIADIRPRQSQ